MQIQTTNSQQVALSKLTPSQQEFVKQRLEPQIKSLSDNQIKRTLKEILSQASFDMGSPMSSDLTVLTFQTEACFNELKGKFGTMTLSEVKSAFRRGIRGEYGAYFGMCPKTYHQFIKAYFEMPERFKAHDEYLKLVEMEENPKREFNNTTAVRELRKDKKLIRHSVRIQKILCNGKLANTTEEASKFLRKKKIKALTLLKEYYEEMGKLALDGQQRLTFGQERDHIEAILKLESEFDKK